MENTIENHEILNIVKLSLHHKTPLVHPRRQASPQDISDHLETHQRTPKSSKTLKINRKLRISRNPRGITLLSINLRWKTHNPVNRAE